MKAAAATAQRSIKGDADERSTAELTALLLSSRTSIGTALRETYHAFVRDMTPRLAGEGLTLRMYLVIRELWVSDGLNQIEIARRSGAHAPGVVGVLPSLERRGLVTRRRDTRDGRVSKIFLTPKGRELQARLLPSLLEMQDLSYRGISKREMDGVLRILTRLRENLAAAN